MLRALGQVRAGQLDDALVALGILALVDRERDIAGADQLRHRRAAARLRHRPRRHRVEPVAVVLRIAAHRALGRDVGDDQPDRPVALGLQRKDAVIFELPGEHDGQGDRLAEHRRHRLRIVVLRQDAVDRRPQPHQAAAQCKRIDAKRLDQIVGSVSIVRRQTQLRLIAPLPAAEREGPGAERWEGEGIRRAPSPAAAGARRPLLMRKG